MSAVFHETKASDFPPTDPNADANIFAVFAPPPPPATALGVSRILAPTAGVRVSPLCLGAMSIGDQWSGYMGGKGLDVEQGKAYLDEFVALGGNFIDTANNYQNEQSEFIIGEWLAERGIRDQIVLATKYTTPYKLRNGAKFPGTQVNYAGNHRKSLRVSVEESLRKLKTDYIDILYVHWWDYSTSIEEVMQGLNDLVRAGKVLYLGISDTPAWIVSAANEYARAHGLSQFVVYQGLWSLNARDLERDIIPMARKYGMAVAPWGVLGQGKFKTPDELKQRAKLRGNAPPTESELKVSAALLKVAEEVGDNASPAGVALAWARAKVPNVYPIVGGASVDQLKDNAKALEIKLSDAQVAFLDESSPFNPGFPFAQFGTDPHYLPGGKPTGFLLNAVSGND
ncbi:Putative aryl-alcohol dehydrogenase AAD14 [Vanrija pseudolonga]|uniref:Aryl-alcohol dehydrogenase AAD14 n=1 Tax=Vanrija pseudolonga TaxID=143232 RepID=A0AAF0YBT2_9TREE|nr:Putative aryl-alcohol dehydrogenase AAD14 [Vanrija pseudolonga]